MADTHQSVDDLLMCLVGMGFEFEDCQQAVQIGKLSVQEAIEWILSGKPVSQQSAASSTLRLGTPSATVGTSPFAPPASTSPPVASSAGEMEDDGKIVSRCYLNDEQQKIKQRFEVKQRGEAQKNAQDEKLAQKRAKASVLQQIQEDRDRQKLMRQNSPSASKSPGSSTGTASRQSPGGSTASAPVDSPEKGTTALIQVRLPNGRLLKKSWPSNSPLKDVWVWVVEQYKQPALDMCLMQPFPRRVYSESDLGSSLSDHGLAPSGSLVLNRIQTPVAQPQPMDTDDPTPTAPPPKVPNSPAVCGPPALPPHTHRGAGHWNHSWGSGHKLESPEQGGEGVESSGGQQERPEAEAEDEEMLEGEDIGPHIPGQGPLPGNPAGMPPWQGGGLGADWGGGGGGGGGGGLPWQQGQQGIDWGYGHRLDAQWAGEEAKQPHHQKDPKKLAASAANQRSTDRPPPGDVAQPSTSSLHYRVLPLSSMVIHNISGRICDTSNPITTLQGLPPEVATQILQHLLKERLLRPKTLQPFISCHLRKLILNAYPYVTNELLGGIRYHNHLTHLSLASCPLITDTGLLLLQALKKLKCLNLMGCKQLTDRCFTLLQGLPCLQTAVLEGTGISDEGVKQYCLPDGDDSHPVPLIQNLNLGRTRVTSRVLVYLSNLPCLKSLSLESVTELTSLSGIQDLQSLESLNLANTSLVTDCLMCLAEKSSLKHLNLSGCLMVDGDLALRYIKGLQLSILYLPSRLTTTDEGLMHITAMPLVELDLTNFNNITDKGIEYIASIRSLKKLRLSNTKLTDGGLPFLMALSSLEELILDRTAVTNIGAAMISIQSFPELQELSLAETGISNGALIQGPLSRCSSLRKLNLSRTAVSDKGLHCLHLSNLTLLNLDHTRTSEGLAEMLSTSPMTALAGCPQLQRVTAKHRQPFNRDQEEN